MEMILNHANAWGKEEMILTIERPTTTNSREPNMTRIILLRLNTAYALEPHTAIRREDRVVKMKKQISIESIRLGRNKILTDNAYSTQNTQNCADSITCIATVFAKLQLSDEHREEKEPR